MTPIVACGRVVGPDTAADDADVGAGRKIGRHALNGDAASVFPRLERIRAEGDLLNRDTEIGQFDFSHGLDQVKSRGEKCVWTLKKLRTITESGAATFTAKNS